MVFRLLNYIALMLLLVTHACGTSKVPLSPAEAKSFTSLSTNKEVISFLEACQQLHPDIHFEAIPLYDSLLFPVVRFSGKQQGENQRIRLMLLGGQHGNEPAGSEGLLMLISALAQGKYDHWLEKAELLILPQCNPHGLEIHARRNPQQIDLNRDHLMLRSSETQIIQQLFHEFDPHFTADFHEYYPFGKAWENFGYLRNFDIQLGGPTNLNTSDEIRYTITNRLMPYIEKQLKANGFTFFEYTLGQLPEGERLRLSTTNINDGRQSFAITGTFSVIVEGMNGRDSLERFESRSSSQMLTAVSLVKWAIQNRNEVMRMTDKAREEISNLQVPVSIRQEHAPDGTKLRYPLKSLKSGADTIFIVENFHPKVISNLDVKPPKAYLIPRKEVELMQWLERNAFIHTIDTLPAGLITAYRIQGFVDSVDEELPNQFASVAKDTLTNVDVNAFLVIPLNQRYNLRLVLALEPQSMYGLINDAAFDGIKAKTIWPVLRLE